MRNKFSWKKTFMVALAVMFSFAITACGSNLDTSTEGNASNATNGELVDIQNTILFDSKRDYTDNTKPGEVVGKYRFEADGTVFCTTVAKPILSDDIASTYENAGFSYVLINETTEDESEELEGYSPSHNGHSRLFFFPNDDNSFIIKGSQNYYHMIDPDFVYDRDVLMCLWVIGNGDELNYTDVITRDQSITSPAITEQLENSLTFLSNNYLT